eukprot:2619312-Prymnesium_polylepis.1
MACVLAACVSHPLEYWSGDTCRLALMGHRPSRVPVAHAAPRPRLLSRRSPQGVRADQDFVHALDAQEAPTRHARAAAA